MLRSTFLTLALFTICTSVVFADAELVHSPTYNSGQVVKSEVETTVEQTLVIGGMNVETGAENFISIEETVKEVSSEKVVLEGKLGSMLMNIKLPGGQEVTFDSGNPDVEIPRVPLEMS